MAVTIKNPIAAMVWFFVAVIMVIVATNMLFISGSVQMCKILKKNKGYYYKANHFVSVSSMAYRCLLYTSCGGDRGFSWVCNLSEDERQADSSCRPWRRSDLGRMPHMSAVYRR